LQLWRRCGRRRTHVIGKRDKAREASLDVEKASLEIEKA
jgi:hypothetical protein